MTNYARLLAAICVWREARSLPDAWCAVAAVIRNRAALHNRGVVPAIAQPWQFTSMTGKGDPNLIQWPADDQFFSNVQATVNEVLDGKVPDPTNGALFYFSAPLTEPPAVWGPVELTLAIGSMRFWRPRTL